MVGAMRDHRAALPEEGKRSSADWPGTHAAHPFHPALVRFNLADFACEEALYDSASLRRFAGIDLGCEPVPDATTMLKFRHLLEQHKLGERLFAEVGRVLQGSGMTLKTGTIVDATIISAPSSTKNADKKRPLFLALSGLFRVVRAGFRPLRAHLPQQSLARQINIGQGQRSESPRGVLLQPTIAHLGKSPQPLDHCKHVFHTPPDLRLAAILAPFPLVDFTTFLDPLVGEVFCLGCLAMHQLLLAGIGTVTIHPLFFSMQQIG